MEFKIKKMTVKDSREIKKRFEDCIKLAEEIKDPIPEKIISELHLPNLQQALQWIHFPQNEKQYLII